MANTVIIDDQCQRADSLPGAPGNNWIDQAGSDWFITGNTLVNNIADFSDVPADPLYRPSGENVQDAGIVVYAGGLSGQFFMQKMGLRCQGGPNNDGYWLEARQDPAFTFYKIFARVGGVNTTLRNAPIGQTYPLGTEVLATFTAVGVNPTTIRVTMRTAAQPNVAFLDFTLTDSTSALQTSGAFAVGGHDARNFNKQRITTYAADGTFITFGSDLGQGVVTVNSTPSRSSVVLGVKQPAGSSTPISTKLYRATDPGVLPGAAGSTLVNDFGAITPGASTTYTDSGLTPGQTYYYYLQGTDSFSPTPGVVNSKINAAYLPSLQYFAGADVFPVLSAFGDSILADAAANGNMSQVGNNNDPNSKQFPFPGYCFDPLAECARRLSFQLGGANVVSLNQSVPGTATTDWISTGGVPTGVFTGALAALNAALPAGYTGPKYCFTGLGTNDYSKGNSLANFQAAYVAGVNYLIAQGFVPIVNPIFWAYNEQDPSPRWSWYVSANTILLNNVLTIPGVKKGAWAVWDWTKALMNGQINPYHTIDFVHPDGLATIWYGAAMADVLLDLLRGPRGGFGSRTGQRPRRRI